MVDIATITQAEHAFTHHEHRELELGIQQLHSVALRVGHLRPRDLAGELLAVLGWVETVLRPHVGWENHVLYDEIDGLAGTTWATRAMRFEHSQILRMDSDLRSDYYELLSDAPTTPHELQLRLAALEALLRAHIEREEALLFPLLDR